MYRLYILAFLFILSGCAAGLSGSPSFRSDFLGRSNSESHSSYISINYRNLEDQRVIISVYFENFSQIKYLFVNGIMVSDYVLIGKTLTFVSPVVGGDNRFSIRLINERGAELSDAILISIKGSDIPGGNNLPPAEIIEANQDQSPSSPSSPYSLTAISPRSDIQENPLNSTALDSAAHQPRSVESDGSPDSVTCQRYGFVIGTNEYAQCRLQIDVIRRQSEEQYRIHQQQLAAQSRAQGRALFFQGLSMIAGQPNQQFGSSQAGVSQSPSMRVFILPNGRTMTCTTTGPFTSCN